MNVEPNDIDVLNLIINGLPSIPIIDPKSKEEDKEF